MMSKINGNLTEKINILRTKIKSINFIELVIILNALNFIIPLIWVGFYLCFIYSFYESIIAWLLLPLAIIFYSSAYYMIKKDKSVLFTIGLLIGMIPLYVFIGYFTLYHSILAFMNIIAVIILFKKNKPRKKIFPKFKSKIGTLMMISFIILLIFPVAFYFLLPLMPIPIIIEDNSADEIEVNWMWAEIWEIPQDVVDALVYCNNLDRVNVSVMVGLPEDLMLNDTYTQFIINETSKLTEANITWDFMPLLPIEDYGYDGLYINDITIDRYIGTIKIFKYWVEKNNLTDKFRAICIDTELYWEKYTSIIFDWWNGYRIHADGAEKLKNAIEELKEIPGDHMVVCATFGMHLDDFIDFDDAQLQLTQLSVFPPWDWDGAGVMIYETGEGAACSIWSSCNAIKYYFGDKGIPYIITSEGDSKNPKKQDLDRIITKFKIIKNEGFTYTGAWALTDFLYYIDDYSARDNTLQKARVKGGDRFSVEDFKNLHEVINNHKGKIVIYYNTLNFSAIHFLFGFLDIWLFNWRFVYDHKWPKIGSKV